MIETTCGDQASKDNHKNYLTMMDGAPHTRRKRVKLVAHATFSPAGNPGRVGGKEGEGGDGRKGGGSRGGKAGDRWSRRLYISSAMIVRQLGMPGKKTMPLVLLLTSLEAGSVSVQEEHWPRRPRCAGVSDFRFSVSKGWKNNMFLAAQSPTTALIDFL